MSSVDRSFWLEKLQDVFLASLTLVPSLLFGALAIPAVQSMYQLAPFFFEDALTV